MWNFFLLPLHLIFCKLKISWIKILKIYYFEHLTIVPDAVLGMIFKEEQDMVSIFNPEAHGLGLAGQKTGQHNSVW